MLKTIVFVACAASAAASPTLRSNLLETAKGDPQCAGRSKERAPTEEGVAASALWCMCNTEELVIKKEERCENQGGDKAKHCMFDAATETCVPRGGGGGAAATTPTEPTGGGANVPCAFTKYWAKVNAECTSGQTMEAEICAFAAKCASAGTGAHTGSSSGCAGFSGRKDECCARGDCGYSGFNVCLTMERLTTENKCTPGTAAGR